MSVDVDAVNERLNGLVALLQAVGVDSNDVARVSKNLGKNGRPSEKKRQLNDEQIEAIIRKLQMAQDEAPHIIAALEQHTESRSLNNGGGRRYQEQQPEEEEHEEEEDDEEDDDDDANYPMVGQGISDDISVVSDLTTPTVLTGVPVPEEEHYRDTLPPMIVGGGPGQAPPMMINPTKRKNLVNPVRPSVAASPRRNMPAPRTHSNGSGGAAAKRRSNYNNQMAILSEPGHAPRQKSSSSTSKPSRQSKSSSNSSMNGEKKVKKKSKAPRPQQQEANNFSDLHSSNRFESPHNSSSDWNAFEPRPASPKRSGAPTVIDNDGFLVGESFDPFASGTNNPFSSSSAGDLAFSGGQQQQHHHQDWNGSHAERRPHRQGSSKQKPQQDPRTMQSSFSQLRQKPQGAASGGRPRRARRASLAM